MISIIVPVYNAGEYIEKCIRSIINQTYSDWELIIVDDESTDNSIEICSGLSQEDNRISIITQKNGGPSKARNYGLEVAKGEYIAFIDADDYVCENYLEYLLDLLQENRCEMSSCGWIVRDNDNNVKSVSPSFATQVFNITDNYNKENVIPFTVWHTLYSTAVLRDNDIHFDESVYYLEDLLFNYTYLKCTDRFVNSSEPLYNWVDSPSSLTRSVMTEEKFKRWFTKIEAREKICGMDGLNSVVAEENIDSLLLESVLMLRDIKKNGICDSDKEGHVKDIVLKNRKRIFRNDSSFSYRRKIRLFFLCYLGIELKKEGE